METSSQQTTLEVCQSPSFSKDLLIINQVVGMHIDMYFEEIPTPPPFPPFTPPPKKKYIHVYIYNPFIRKSKDLIFEFLELCLTVRVMSQI